MAEQKESIEICKSCGQPVTAHSKDCSLVAEKKEYQEKIHKFKMMEGLTKQFVEDIKAGKITYEKQIEEIGENLKKIFLEDKENKTPEDFQKIWDSYKEELRELNEEFHNLKVEFSNYTPVIVARIKDAFDEELKGKYEKARKIIMSEHINISSIIMKQFNDYPTVIREIGRTITQERLKIEKFKKIFEEIKSY